MKKLIKHSFSLNKKLRYIPAIVITLLGLTPLIWFYGRAGVLINGIDTNFPLSVLNWFLRRFFVWDAIANAGRDFSSSTAGLFFHSIQVIPHMLGASLQNVQLASLIFWFLLIVFSAYTLAKIILPRNLLIQLLFVVLYSFNIYLFNTWENVKVANLSLVAAVPFALSILLLLRDHKISTKAAVFYSTLVGVVLSGSGINPSYFIAFFLIIGIYIFSEIATNFKISHILARLRDFLLVSSFIILVNSFWILPTINFVFKNVTPTGSIDKLGFTNWIDSLSENTSLLNIMRLQGAWDWYAFDSVAGVPLYTPYALNYFFKFPFLAFSFLLPLLAIISLTFRRRGKEHLYVAFGLMFIVGVFLGSGTHLPTGILYRWLINHLPFFTLFRSPWYIFTPLVTLSLAALVSLLFYKLDSVFKNLKLVLGRGVVFLAVLVLIVGNFLYSYPLITGKIFRPGRHDSFFVEFPDYVFDAQEWLSKEDKGRIVGYPDDEIENFNWGYRGIESILALISDRETLFAPLNAPDAPVSKLIKEFYRSLTRGEVELAHNLAYKLAADVLFEKRDQKSLAPKIQLESWPLNASFGEWYFYELNKNSDSSKLRSVKKVFLGYPYLNEPRLVGLLEKDDLLLNPDDIALEKIQNLRALANAIIKTENSQLKELTNFVNSVSRLENRLLKRDFSKVYFDFYIPKTSLYKPILDRYRLEDFGLDVAEGKFIGLELDGMHQNWKVIRLTDAFVYFESIELSEGPHRVFIKLDSKNLITGGDFENSFSFEHKFVKEIQVEKTDFGRNLLDPSMQQAEIKVIETGDGHSFSILNKGSLKSIDLFADFTIPNFDPQSQYLVEVKYQQIYGSNASVIVFQNTADTLVKSQTERLPNYPQMNNFSFFFEPVKTESTAKVSLLAPYINDPLGTKVVYDDLAVYKVFTNQMFFMESDDTKPFPTVMTDIKKISPVLYEAEVDGGENPHILYFAENYSPEWELSLYNNSGKPISVEPVHFSGNLFANIWYIENAPEKYKVRIFYRPQRLFWFGLGMSVITIILAFALTNLTRLRQFVGRLTR